MDKAEKLILVISSLLLVVFLSSVVFAVVRYDIGLPTCITSMEPFADGEVIEHDEGRYEVHMLAMMWEFEPEEIEFPQHPIVYGPAAGPGPAQPGRYMVHPAFPAFCGIGRRKTPA